MARKPVLLVGVDLTAGSENCNSLSGIGGRANEIDSPEVYPQFY